MLPTIKTNPTAQSAKDPPQTSQQSVHPGGLKSEGSMPKSNLYQENVVTQGAWRLSSSSIPSSTQCPNNPLDLWQRLPQKCSNLMNWHFLIKKICFLQSLLSSNKLTTSKDLSSQPPSQLPCYYKPPGWSKPKSCASTRDPLSLFDWSRFPKLRIY